MTAIETKYNGFIGDLRVALECGDKSLVQKMDKEMISIISDWCMEAPRSVLELKEELTNDQVDKGLTTCVPIIRELTDGSFVMLVHGTPDGKFMDGFWGEVLHRNDDRVSLYFPVGATVYVLSCYPGSRESEWTHLGVHFINLAHDAGPIPLGMGIRNNHLYVREVSSTHAELISDMMAGKI